MTSAKLVRESAFSIQQSPIRTRTGETPSPGCESFEEFCEVMAILYDLETGTGFREAIRVYGQMALESERDEFMCAWLRAKIDFCARMDGMPRRRTPPRRQHHSATSPRRQQQSPP